MRKANLEKVTETVFYAIAEKSTKIPCWGIFGQPKMPEHLRNLRKSK